MGKPYSSLKLILIPLLVTAAVALALYYLTSAYFLKEAEDNLQNVLLSNRGVHHYIQRNLHPAYFKGIEDGEISRSFYNPEMLSSTYMVRVMHRYYNEERVKDGLPEIYYKMAANNPRNPVNKADEREAEIIRYFNENPEAEAREEIVEVKGKKYIYYAIPFLKNEERCLRCHGNRDDAPPGLQALYPEGGGFNERVGEIRAIESIRVPVGDSMNAAYIVSGASAAGVLALLVLFMFNSNLRTTVDEKTASLRQEISERVLAEERIRLSLEENQVLLAEVHHRVKNNMAVISSFLNLQILNTDDAGLQEILKESRQRIKTMALVHENLYKSPGLKHVDLQQYIKTLVSDIMRTHGFKERDIELSIEIDPVEMELDLLIPLGLVVNEIVTNAFKHAFAAQGAHRFHIGIKEAPEGVVTLTVWDNGPGLKEGLSLEDGDTLGAKIISALIRQINGKMTVGRNGGVKYEIVFSLEGEQ